MIKSLYANTWEELITKMIGYYHDHCYHYYTGTCDDLPEKYKNFKNKNIKYVFIYEEDTPIKKLK